MARFDLSIAAIIENRTIQNVPAHDWASLVEPITGLLPGDVITQAAFTVKIGKADSDTAGTSVQRIISAIAGSNGAIDVANNILTFYFTPSDTYLMLLAHWFDLQLWVTRGANVYIKTVLTGRIFANLDVTNSTTLLDPATQIIISGALPLTGAPGDTHQLVGTVENSSNVVLPGIIVTWTSTNPLVASVDPTGMVRFWTQGTCNVVAAVPAYSISSFVVATITDQYFITAVVGNIPRFDGTKWVPVNPTVYFLSIGGGTLTGNLTISAGGLTVSAGGLTITTGGLTVSAGTTAVQALTATLGTFSGQIRSTMGDNSIVFLSNNATTGYQYQSIINTGGSAYWGVDNSAGSGLLVGGIAYSSVFASSNATAVVFGTNSTARMVITSGGSVYFGTDPGGAQLVRIGGSMVVSGTTTLSGGLIVGAGTTALQALTVSGTTMLTGNVGVGIAAQTNQGTRLHSTTSLVGANQYGLFVDPVMNSDATGATAGYFSITTIAAAFTVTSAYGLYVADGSKGAGSAITTLYGLYIAAQTQGATNYAIYSAGGKWNQADTTQATSTTTGSIVTAGGLGVAKNAFFGGTLAVTGTTTLTGIVTATSGVLITGGVTNPGMIFKSSTSGLTISGVAGSSYDFAVTNSNGSSVLLIATGTNSFIVNGTLTTTTSSSFHATSVPLSDYQNVSAGTLTNAPFAGNPTKFIGINDNGTVRYIPAW